MVRSTKRCLLKSIGKQKLTYEELSTVLTEVEAVLNNRPLTYLDEDDKDEVLTPSHLFCGRRTLTSNFGEPYVLPDHDDTATSVGVRGKRVVAAVDRFWKRWSKEYLLELRQHHKMNSKSKPFDAKKGDAVLIHEDNVKRIKWSVGVIDDFVIGRDGVIRGAAVRKIGGDGRPQLVHRPLQKLYPLEISSATNDVHDAVHDTVGNDAGNDNDDAVGDNDKDDAVGDNDTTVADHPCSNAPVRNDSSSVELRRTTSKRSAAVRGEIRRRATDAAQRVES